MVKTMSWSTEAPQFCHRERSTWRRSCCAPARRRCRGAATMGAADAGRLPGPNRTSGALDPRRSVLPVLSFDETELAQIAAALRLEPHARPAPPAPLKPRDQRGARARADGSSLAGAVQRAADEARRAASWRSPSPRRWRGRCECDTDPAVASGRGRVARHAGDAARGSRRRGSSSSSDCARTLRAALPEIAAQLGCAGRLEVEADPACRPVPSS